MSSAKLINNITFYTQQKLSSFLLGEGYQPPHSKLLLFKTQTIDSGTKSNACNTVYWKFGLWNKLVEIRNCLNTKKITTKKLLKEQLPVIFKKL